MDDLISRQDAIDAVVRAMIDGADAELVEGIMELLPSAQPEVIRCKDCKHRPTLTGADGHIEQGFSLEFPDNVCPCQCEDCWYNWYPSDDFYCGYAERREDENRRDDTDTR